jgi:type I restriction enzyme S subunit
MKKGWQTKKLGDVCAFDKAQGLHHGLPYVGLEHIESHTARFIGSSEPLPVRSSTFRFSNEHVLYGRLRPYLNKALAPNFDGHCSTEIFPLKPRPELSREFLLFWLLADETCDRINETCTGARMPRAQMNDVLGFEIPVPPLAEQQRIVGLLDEAFEGLATAKANAEKNLQNARALFESHLQSVFTQGSLSAADGRGPGWVETTLDRATAGVFTGPFGSLLHKHDYVENGIPLVNPAHITDTGIEPDTRKTVSEATAKRLANYIMHEGDVVIGRRGEMGRCALVTEVEDGWLCGTGSFYIKPSDRCDMGYLVRYLRSESCRKQLEALAGGAVMPNLSNTALGGLSIFLPPLREQKKVVNEIDALSEETQRLARLYERKHAALEALKKSLLHQAFTGKL